MVREAKFIHNAKSADLTEKYAEMSGIKLQKQ